MGNQSRRKPPTRNAPPSPPPKRSEPPRFAVVRTEVDEIKIVNVAQIAIARFTLLGGGKPFLTLETVADHLAASFEARGGTFDPEEFHGDAARDLAAHLILCGVDVQGAREALARSRGDLYAAYFGAPARDAGEAFDEYGGGCACLTPPPAEPPPLAAADCLSCIQRSEAGTCDAESEIVNGACEFYTDRDEQRESVRATLDGVRAEKAAEASEAIAALAAERQRAEEDTRREATEAAARAAFEVARRKARERAAVAEKNREAEMNEETRAACAFGENCKRFPRCGDCSLYALEEAAEPADVAHVEEVAGETRAQLEARRDACAVFRGLVSSGVVGKYCGVGHEMSDPACALCRFLRVYSPA